jgi:selenocysteine-specific elongation factor
MQTVVVGTAGHIDHGKSALVKALTGTDPDRLKEEQQRGITIDLGFAHFEAGDRQIAFVDVPGHERFVRNMLAGAGGIDAVLLVVDAGESVMPQTREHFEICRMLGLDRGIVALTKVDVAGPDAIARARAGVTALVAGSFLEGAPVLEVSARTGQGLEALRAALLELAGRPSRQQRPGLVRLPIDRAFTIKGFGAVVTGTLVSGDVGENDAVTILPDQRVVRVRGVQTHGRRVSRAASPQRAALNLAGVEAGDLRRGQTIATDGSLSVTRSADVEMELLAGARALRHGTRVRVHQGASEIAARVSVAAIRLPSSGEWTRVEPGASRVEIPGGASAFVRLRFGAPAVLTRGDRLVFRAGSPAITIGGGIVLDPEPPAAGVRRPQALARFLDLTGAAPPLAVLLAERGEQGLTAADLVRRCGTNAERASAAVAELVAAGSATRVGGGVVHTPVLERLEARVIAELGRFHDVSPADDGLARGALRDRAGKALSDDLFSAALGRLATRGVITGTDRLALSGRAPTVSDAQSRLAAKVEAEVLAGNLAPADPGAIARTVGAAPADVDRAIQWLARDKRVVRAGDLFFHRDALAHLKAEVQSIRRGQPPAARVTLDVATFKSKFNLSRKHAIPLLEWLDRERVTRRTGDVRIVL